MLVRELPNLYHPDEPTNLGVVARIVTSGDLNPHFFAYPSLFLYLHALPYLPGQLLGGAFGLPTMPSSITDRIGLGVSLATDPAPYVLARSITALLSAVGIVLLFFAVRRLTSSTIAALLSAALLAASPIFLQNSVYATPDVPATTAVVVVLFLAVRAADSPSRAAYVWAGIAVGLAMSLKYNAVLSGVMVLLVAIRHREGRLLDRRFWWAVLAACIAFILTTPFSVLDPVAFIRGAGGEVLHYRTGHLGMEGDTPSFYANLLITTEPFVVVGAVASLALVRRRGWQLALVWSFPLLYALSVGMLAVRNDRTIMLIIPMLCALSAIAVTGFASALKRRGARAVGWVAAVAVVLAGLGVATMQGVRVVQVANGIDNRALAQVWINDHVPPGAVILMDAYAPWVDRNRNPVVYVQALDQAAPLFPANPQGIDYVITSNVMRDHYLAAGGQYAANLAASDALLGRLRPVHRESRGVGAAIDVLVPADR